MSYFKLEHENASYFYHESPPPTLMMFDFHSMVLSTGIFTDGIQIGINLPTGHIARLLGNNIEVIINDSQGHTNRMTLEIYTLPIYYKNMEMAAPLTNYYRKIPQPIFYDGFAPLVGDTSVEIFPLATITSHKGYFYKANCSVPQKTSGNIKFPDLEIDGLTYPGPTISYRWVKEWFIIYFGP
jgi:hypothetical protein